MRSTNLNKKIVEIDLAVKNSKAFLCGKAGNDMTVEELVEQFLCDRIDLLMKMRPEDSIENDKELCVRQEEITKGLESEVRISVERLLEDLIIQSGEDSRYLYLAGVNDGIRLAKVFLKL